MNERRNQRQSTKIMPTQKTPQGLEIPVPKRKDVDAALKKLVQPVKKRS